MVLTAVTNNWKSTKMSENGDSTRRSARPLAPEPSQKKETEFSRLNGMWNEQKRKTREDVPKRVPSTSSTSPEDPEVKGRSHEEGTTSEQVHFTKHSKPNHPTSTNTPLDSSSAVPPPASAGDTPHEKQTGHAFSGAPLLPFLSSDQVERIKSDIGQYLEKCADKATATPRTATLNDLLPPLNPTPTLKMSAKPSKTDKEYWNCKKGSSPQCPRCPRGLPNLGGRKDSISARTQHYKRFHYDIYYELITSSFTHLERFNLKTFGDSKKDIRCCIYCSGEQRFETQYKTRVDLYTHMRKLHRPMNITKVCSKKYQGKTPSKADKEIYDEVKRYSSN